MIQSDNKIKNNLFKLGHSSLITILSGIHIIYPNIITQNLIFFISECYFTIDTIILFKSDIIEYPLVYHHVLAMILLYCFYIDYYGSLLIYLYFMGELSNIFLYITYHLIKTSSSEILIIGSNILQTFIYGYLRIYCFTDIFIKNYEIILYTPLCFFIGIYLMGFVWFFTLCKQIYLERITIRYLIYDNLIQN
jgi:hypothetical protein